MHEPQIKEATKLTFNGKRLNKDAVGWATQPIINTDKLKRGMGRNKRWEYWNVVTPDYILAVTLSHIDYACVPEIWVYEVATGKHWGMNEVVLPAKGTVLAGTLEQGSSTAATTSMSITVDEEPGGTRIKAYTKGVSFDVFAELPKGHERLALVVPWSETRFQYTVKDVARPATGSLVLDGKEIKLPAGTTWAVLDHGRGRWPYDINWNWGAGSGRSNGKVIGIQVGAKWTEGTSVSENAFFVDGKMHKIHGETKWDYDVDEWRTPWRISGGGLDATLTPFYNKGSRMNFGIVKGSTDQCFGTWSGSFKTEAGELIEFDSISGFAEEVHNRW